MRTVHHISRARNAISQTVQHSINHSKLSSAHTVRRTFSTTVASSVNPSTPVVTPITPPIDQSANTSTPSPAQPFNQSPPAVEKTTEEKRTERRIRFWFRVLIASAIGIYAYDAYNVRSQCLVDAEEHISSSEDEILDLLSRCRITSNHLIDCYTDCLRMFPTGLLTLEQFAQVLQQHVDQAKQVRATKRAQKKDQPVEQIDENDYGSYWDSIELHEEKEFKEATDLIEKSQMEEISVADLARLNHLRLVLRRPNFEWFELLSLYRTTEPITGSFYDIRDLIIGATQLSYDHRPWSEAKATLEALDKFDPNEQYSDADRLQICYDPSKKLELAWRLSDERHTNRLNFNELVALCKRLELTGHFSLDSIVQMSDAQPPKYSLLTPRHIARMIMTRSQIKNSIDNAEQSPFITTPFTSIRSHPEQAPASTFLVTGQLEVAPVEKLHALTPLASLSDLPASSIDALPRYIKPCEVVEPCDEHATISYAEFLSACKSLSTTTDLVLWYLIPRNIVTGERAGPIRKRRMKWQERARLLISKPVTTETDREWERICVG